MTIGLMPAVKPASGENPDSVLPLRINFSWMLAGNVIYRACQWGIMMALAKIGTPEILGLFALGVAVTSPITTFTNMNLGAIQATDASNEYPFRDYLSLRLISLPVAILIITAFAFIGTHETIPALVILTVGLCKCIESISDILFGLFQKRERLNHVAISLMMKGPVTLFALILAVSLTRSILWGTMAMAVAYLVLLISYDIPVARRLLRDTSVPRAHTLATKSHSVARLAWLALPMALVVCLISLKTNIPRYFVKQDIGEAALGVFTAISYLMLVGDQITAALGQAALPRLAKNLYTEDKAAFKRLVMQLTVISALIGAAGILAAALIGQRLLILLYRVEFAEHHAVLVWLMAAGALQLISNVFGTAITAMREFRIQFALHAFSVIAMSFLCFILVPKMHLAGAALAMFYNYMFMCVVYGTVMLLELKRIRKISSERRASLAIPYVP